MYEPGSRSPMIEVPGASRSAWRVTLPTLLNVASVSSPGLVVAWVSAAPTASTYGLSAGMVTEVAAAPSLPTETTTTIPLRQADSTACESGSTCSLCTDWVPKDRLSTRMFMPGSLRWATTQSIPAITCDTSVAPSPVATFRLISLAPGATPALDAGSSRGTELSLAAMMLPMWVPCPNVSLYRVVAVCDSKD